MDTRAVQSNPQENVDLRMRTLWTLWLALVLSVVMYFVFTIFVGRNENAAFKRTTF